MRVSLFGLTEGADVTRQAIINLECDAALL